MPQFLDQYVSEIKLKGDGIRQRLTMEGGADIDVAQKLRQAKESSAIRTSTRSEPVKKVFSEV